MSDLSAGSGRTPKPYRAPADSSNTISPPDPNFLYLYDNVEAVSNPRQLFGGAQPSSTGTRDPPSLLDDRADEVPTSSKNNYASSTSPRIHATLAHQSSILTDSKTPPMIDETTPQEDMIRMYRKLRADFLHVREIGVTSLTSLQKDLEEVFSDTAQADAARAEAECKAEELQSLLSASQTQITGLQQELASSRESVQQQKEALLATLVSDRLEASDEDYARLATRPAESLTLHERVQQKIWTVVHHHRSREAAAAEHVRELSLRVQTQALETAQARRAAEAAEQELASVNARLEAQRGEQELQARKLNGLLTEAHADVAEMRDKARRYDDVCLRVRSLEEENARLTFERGEREARQSGLEERCDGIIARERDYEQQIKLLALDKEHLSHECISLREEQSRLQKDATSQRERADEACRARDAANAELVRVQTDGRLSLEQRVEREVEKVTLRVEREMELARRLQQEAYDRELSGLRHDKDDLQRRARVLEEELREVRRLREETEGGLRADRALVEGQLGEATALLRVKLAEHTQISASYDEISSELRRVRVELDVAQEKARAAKEEYILLREETSRRETQMRSTEKSLRERLQAYSVLEQDLDLAVLNAGVDVQALLEPRPVLGDNRAVEHVRTGRPPAADAVSQSGDRIRGVDTAMSLLGASGTPASAEMGSDDESRPRVIVPSVYKDESAPTPMPTTGPAAASLPRLRQSLLLAHRLVEKQAELDAARRQLQEAQALATRQQQELDVIQAAARRSSGLRARGRVGACLRDVSESLAEDDPRRAEISAILAEEDPTPAPDSVSGVGALYTHTQSPVGLTEHAKQLTEEIQQKDLLVESLRTRVLLLEREKRDADSRARELQSKFAKEAREMVQQQHSIKSLRGLLARLMRVHGKSMSREELSDIASMVRSVQSGETHGPRPASPKTARSTTSESTAGKPSASMISSRSYDESRDSARARAREEEEEMESRTRSALEFAIRKMSNK